MTRATFIASLLLASLVGCSGQSITKVSVAGVVLLEGQPVPNVEVAFLSNSNPMAFGITDADGKYTLATRQFGNGVAPGDYTVQIRNLPDSTDATLKVPLVYGERGVEKVTVGRERTSTFDFDLSKNPGKSSLNPTGDAADEGTEA